MIGSVERFILTPIVLRFARKYIKDAEGAAASDLRVSVSGGSVVFRNFELNLEEIVKDLPCSTVRAFARKLHIKIPWTKLATNPIEVVLDTVECVFAQGKQSYSSPSSTSSHNANAANGRTPNPQPDAGEADGGWIGSLLERALSNITVRVDNIVCKYLFSGHVLTVSCQSAEIFSAGNNWEKAFLELEAGLRKRAVVRNISVSLDKLTADGKVDAYQDPLIRTSTCDIRFAFVSLSTTVQQRCSLDVRLESWDATVSDWQLQVLQEVVPFREKENEVLVKSTEQMESSQCTSDIPVKQESQSWDSDSSAVDSDSDETPHEKGPVGRVASASVSMIGWAWNFLAEEEVGEKGSEAEDMKEVALRELGAASGTLQLHSNVDWLIQCKLKSGKINCRSDVPSVVLTEKSLSANDQVTLPTPPLLTPTASQTKLNLGLIGTLFFENPEVYLFYNAGGLQAASICLDSFTFMQPPNRDTCILDNTILSLCPSVGGIGDREHHGNGKDGDLSTRFLLAGDFSIHDFLASAPASSLYSETADYWPLQSQGALHMTWWQNTTKTGISQGQNQCNASVSISIGVFQVQYCPALMEQWLCWIRSILKENPQGTPSLEDSHMEVPNVSEPASKVLDSLEAAGNQLKSITGTSDEICAPLPSTDKVFLLFTLSFFQFTVDTFTFVLLSADSSNSSSLLMLKTSTLCASLRPSQERGSDEKGAHHKSIHISVKDAEIIAGQRCEAMELFHSVVPRFSIHACCGEGGQGSLCGFSGLLVTLDMEGLSFNLNGTDTHVVARVLAAHVPLFCLNVFPPSTFEGVWLGGQLSQITVKVGHFPDRASTGGPSVHIGSIELQLFGSRVDVFGKDETVPGLVFDGSDKQPIIEGEDRQAFSGEQCCSSLSIRTVKLYLTNQTLMLMQALQQMNDSFEKPINSREHSDSGVLEKKVCSLKRSHFLLVEEAQGHLIALHSSDSPQTFQVWDGQMVSCVSGTHLRLGLVLGGVEELSPQEQSLSSNEVCDMSLHASLRQIELSLGYIDLGAVLEKGRSLRMCAMRNVGESIICVSGVYCVSEQAHDVISSQQPFSPQVISKKLAVDIKDVLLDIPRHHYVWLYEFAKNFYSIQPVQILSSCDSIDSDNQSEMHHNQDKAQSISAQQIKMDSSLQIARIFVRLGLWRDGLTESLEGVGKESSKLIIAVEGASMSTLTTKRVNPSHSNSNLGFGTCLPQDQSEISDQRKLRVIHLQMSTSRVQGSDLSKGEDLLKGTKQEDSLVHIFPLIKRGVCEEGTEASPILEITWSVGTQGLSTGLIELSPLDWYIDSRVIEEIITVIWERRKHVTPVAGVDVLPVTGNLRIVARAGRLHVLPLFSVQETAELVFTSDYFVGILDNSTGSDARRYLGVHDGSTPGVMDPNKLKVQNFDVSLVGWKMAVTGPRFAAPAILIPPSDIHVVGRLLGCPGPILLSFTAQSLTLNVCMARLSIALAVLSSLLDGWSATWPLRQCLSSQENTTDDLRTGVFQKSSSQNQHLGKGEINWGDGSDQNRSGSGGWICWRYPYPRSIREVLISEQLFSEVPGLSVDTTAIFQLSLFDQVTGVFVDAAPLLVAREGELKYQIEPFSNIIAEEWRLSWFLPPSGLPTSSSSKIRPLPATNILKLLQVNRTTTGQPPLGDIPALLPFMLVDFKAEEVRFSLVEGWDDTEAAAAQGSQFHVGYHFWNSGLWTLATTGVLLAEYTDMATYTHELLLEPVETSLQLSSCSVSPADMKANVATKDELESQLSCDTSLAPQEVRHPPTVPGYCLWLQTRGKLTLHLQKSILQESSRIGHLLSPGDSTLVPADSESQGSMDTKHLQSGVDKLGQFAFTIENACPIDLVFRQTGSEELIAIRQGGCHQYAWHSPPKLSPLAERKLEIRNFSVGANHTLSNGKERTVPDPQKWWCDPIEIEKEGVYQRRLLLDPTTAICVVVEARCSQPGRKKVVIRPSFRLTNMTSSVLKIRICGLFPTKFLDILLTSIPGTNFTGGSNEEAAPVVSEGELFLQLSPSKRKMSGMEIMFATTLVRQSMKQVTMSVLIEGIKGWSTWAPLEELTCSSIKLLLKNECVEWKRSGGVVPQSSPLLCLEHRGSEGDFTGQSSVVLWPLFYVQNSLFRSLHLQVGLQGSDVVSQELHHDEETPLSVTMSGRQYVLASITKSEKTSDEPGTSWIDGRGTPNCTPESSSVGEALDNAGLVLAQIRRDEERLKTRPILLTASIFRVGTRFDITYQELPPVGSHNVLTFSSPNTGHVGFSCILRTSFYRDGLPTILISFVPMAVFHNYLPLAMAVRDAWLPPEAPLAAWASSGEKSAFSLQGLPGQQCGKKVCIGMTVEDQLQHTFAEDCVAQTIENHEKNTLKEWLWSMPIEVETDSIQEVMVGASNKSFCFLLRTQITLYNVEDDTEACMCCHLSIYPLMLVSNFSGHSLRFWYRGLSSSSFWDCPDRSKLAPMAAWWVNTGTPSPKPQVTIGLLISSLRDPMVPVHRFQSSALTGDCQSFEQHLEQRISLLGSAKSEPIDYGTPELQKSDEPSSHTLGVDYIWSDCIDLDKMTQQSRVMFSLGNNRAHIMMLTYSLVSVDGQTHLLIHRDPQPPFVILNDTEWQLEVKGGKNDSSVLRVMSYAKLECDLTGLDAQDSDPFENLDELFLSSTKQEQSKTIEICIRVMGHVWSKPLDVTLQKTMKYEAALDGTVVLSVRVEQLGPTFFVHISPFQEKAEVVLPTKFISKVANITDINIIADIEKLRLSVLDDDLRTLRGPDLSGLRQHRGERQMASVSDEVCFATIEKLSCRVSRHLKMSALPGVPGVSVHKMLLTAALLQVDIQSQESELPVLITTGVSSSVVQQQQPWKNVVDKQGLRVMLELCKGTDETVACFPLWLQKLHVTLMPLTVNIDNASFALGRRLSSSATQDRLGTSSAMKETGRQIGDAPDHFREFFLLEPQFHVESFQVQDLEFFVTLRIARPVVVNIHQAPVVLSAFSVTGVKFPLVVLVRGLLAHYATQCVLNAPSVLGSMDILFNVTGLVKSLQAGLNDLLRLPVQGFQHGPHGFLFGLGAGGFSLVRHISVWTFTSLAGFALTLAQVLELTYSDVPSAPPVGNSFSRGWIGLGQGVARGVSGIILTPMRAATGGRSNFLLGVGKGLVGAVAGPVSGALQLVAHTSQGLIGTSGAVSKSSISVEASETHNSGNEQQSCAPLISTRSSRLRFQKQILSGTTERYMTHTDVMSLVYTNGMDQSPRTLRRPVLLLSDRAIRALEDGGSLETASILLSGMDIDEDSVTHTLTIYSAEGGSLRERHGSTLSNSKDGLQLYAQLEETAWQKWIPLLRRAVPRSSFLWSR